MKHALARLGYALVVVILSGCPSRERVEIQTPLPTLVVVKQLKVDDQTPISFRPAAVPVQELRSLILGALSKHGVQTDRSNQSPLWKRWKERAKKAGKPIDAFLWTLELDLHALYGIQTKTGMARVPDVGTVKAMLRGDVALRPPGRVESFYLQVDQLKTRKYDPKSGPLKPLYTEFLGAMAQSVAERIKIGIDVYEKPVSELITLVKSPNPSVRMAVVQRLSMTREKSAVDAIASQLKVETNRDMRHRMIGALAEIGDEKAAQALIHLANPRDRETLSAILDALTVVGGKRVEDFLDILSMHDASDIRDMVVDARRRWARRQSVNKSRSSAASKDGTKEK